MEQEAACQLLGSWKGESCLEKNKNVFCVREFGLWAQQADFSSAVTPAEVRGVTLQINLPLGSSICRVLSTDESFGLNKNQQQQKEITLFPI